MKIPIADVVIINNGKVLLVQQHKKSAYALWSFPGGRVEDGETAEQAVRREVKEELGTDIVNPMPFKVYNLGTPTGVLELNTFTGMISSKIELKKDELMAYGWFSLDQLRKIQDGLRAPIVLQQACEVLKAKRGWGEL